MFNKIILYLKHFDWILFTAVLLLVCFGLVEIYSVALGQSAVNFFNFKKQLIFATVGLFLLFVFALIDYYQLRNYSNHLFILGAIILISLLFFGQTIRGSKSWFYLAGFGFQAVELIKILLILFLARYFSSTSLKNKPLKHLIISGSGSLIFTVLVLAQPDFGSALILFLLWLAMIALAGFNKKYFVVILLLIALAAAWLWFFIFQDYQKQRIITFFRPSYSQLDQGYNASQALIAIGSGGLFGRGLGFGSQSQLKFLPAAQTDFIFAVIAEELGFLGVTLVIFFFAAFFWRLLSCLKKLNNDFAVFFVLGALGLIFIEMLINIAMNMGLLPIIGISLPFVSYGGSSLISSLILVGITQSIIIRSKMSY